MTSNPADRLAMLIVAALIATACQPEPSEAVPVNDIYQRPVPTLADARSIFPDSRLAELAQAACEGDRGRINALLKSGVAVDGLGVDGFTPLSWAMQCPKTYALDALLEAGANPNQLFPAVDGRSLVWIAANRNDVKALKLLARYGGDINFIDRQDVSVLGASLRPTSEGMDDAFYWLLENGVDINGHTVVGTVVRSAADRAVGLGWFDKAHILLERGYSTDLPGLAFGVETRRTDKSSENFRWQLKVHEWLKSRGIEPEGNAENLARARAEGVLIPDPSPSRE